MFVNKDKFTPRQLDSSKKIITSKSLLILLLNNWGKAWRENSFSVYIFFFIVFPLLNAVFIKNIIIIMAMTRRARKSSEQSKCVSFYFCSRAQTAKIRSVCNASPISTSSNLQYSCILFNFYLFTLFCCFFFDLNLIYFCLLF